MIRFEHPWALALALLALPLVVLGWRVLRRGDRARRTTILVLRTAVLLGIVTMLAGPQSVREHHHLTVIGLLDVSGSVKRFASLPDRPDLGISSNIGYLRHWFREATGTREPDDRFGLVVFDGDAVAISAPTSGPYVDDNLDVSVIEGTNVEAAIRLGLAMFPPDSARRLVLVTDGNETTGSAIDAARVAGGGASLTTVRVPVDVVPIEYRLGGDVRVARIEAPPNGQPGQSITLRIVVESTIETQGTLSLLAEERPVDLNGDAPGRDRRIRVPVGESVHFATIALGDTPLNRFEARFTPDDPAADALSDNNHAESFTSTPGRGRVLIVSHVEPNDHPLAAALVASRLPVEVVPPSGLTTSLLALQAYDLVVLDDVGAYEIMPEQQEMLAVYVNDFGGGLLMVGGENGFGAGGWNGTPVEAVLPLELDPPRELRLPGAALVLVLDRSGSMNRSVAGARASQQTVANEGAALAVESLRAESYIGVIAFDSTPHVQVELQLNDDPAAIAERIRAIQSDGGTAIRPALERARSMLRDCDAPKKRVVLLTDGRSPNAGMDTLVEAMKAENIIITTIAVGDGADQEFLAHIADLSGGEFYEVRDPNLLPRVLIDSVQIINKPLLKEGDFTPVLGPAATVLAADAAGAPMLGGLVITAPRDDPRITMELFHPDGEPLLAHWQAGLGHVAAFTSDATGLWSAAWLRWAGYDAFWAQLVRTVARQGLGDGAELVATIRNDDLHLAFEAGDDAEGFLDYLQVDGVVYGANGRVQNVRLRQVAPGRYEASVPAPDAGNYIVALKPRRGDRLLSPLIGGASKTSSIEFSRTATNTALLREIAEQTGGRRLPIEQPDAADLYDRRDMPPSRSLLPFWRTLLLLALPLLLLDVAARRIAWDGPLVVQFARAMIARMTPARARGEQATATLAGLRRASDAVDERLAGESEGVTKLEGDGAFRAPARSAEATRTPADVAAAIDALRGRAATSRPDPAKDAPPTPTPDPEAGSTETARGLLAAKRRAQQRMRDG